jgi:hypothetical protein
MSPITHFLASWSVAEVADLDERDKAIVTWIGTAPDLDGFGALTDTLARVLGFGEPDFYERFHHGLLHGLFGSLVLPAIGLALARRRAPTFLLGVAVVHLHLACDLVGSRGVSADQIWPIRYLGPFSESLTWAWAGQWPLNGWPNILFTVCLMGWVMARAATVGHSPVRLFNRRADAAFVSAVQARWRQWQRRR